VYKKIFAIFNNTNCFINTKNKNGVLSMPCVKSAPLMTYFFIM